MDKIIPTLTIKPKKPKKVKKKNNIKLEFLNKPEPIKKANTKGRGPDIKPRKLKDNKPIINNKKFIVDDNILKSKSVENINNVKKKLPKYKIPIEIQNIIDDKDYEKNQINKLNKILLNNEIIYTGISKNIINDIMNKNIYNK
jgi:hypothetical protein